MQDLYFVAIVPPAEVAVAVDNLRHEAAEKFGASHVLKSPPHITIIPPFKLGDKNPEELKSVLRKCAHGHDEISVKAEGFGHFGNSIYVDIKAGKELSLLQAEVEEKLRSFGLPLQQDERVYHPHLSIATKDLHRKKFRAAWEHFRSKSFGREFRIGRVNLLHHSGKRWLIEESFSLNGQVY